MAKHIPETVMSYIAGLVYAVGFFIWVDGAVSGRDADCKMKDSVRGIPYNFKIGFVDWIPLIVGTIALILINIPPHNYIFDDEENGIGLVDEDIKKKAYIWLFVSFIVGFAGVALGIWRAIKMIKRLKDAWPGIASIISAVLVFASSIVYRFQRAFEEQDDAAF